MPDERVAKFLAAAGVASRRGADALIEAGRVTIDGRPVVLGERADPSRHAIAVDGRLIGAESPRIHLALHKPPDTVSTVRDPHAGRTVVDLVPDELRATAGRLYPVGRLDRDSEGLLLVTNDGPWADRVLHPRHGIEREYMVGLAYLLGADAAARLREGIDLEEGRAQLLDLRPATGPEVRGVLAVVAPGPTGLHWYRVTLAHGWKRQVRRMFATVGAPVIRLVRVRIGPVRLGSLASGEVRRLLRTEVAALRASD